MNYIYDIVLNFQDHYYNFFEWNKSDKIKNINKIPVYHISDEDLLILKNNQVVLDINFLPKTIEKNKKSIIILVSNTKLSLGLLINNEGVVKKRSSLLFDEEEEVNNLCRTLPLTKINYLKNTPKKEKNKLRVEIEKKEPLINYIKELNNPITLKYLYYEYFNKECKDQNIIKRTLLKELKKSWNNKQKQLYNIIKLLNKNIPTK